ncbi:TetR/AcrR family transcriptional regulator [Sporofaciens sp. SGI.106]|uniref:TetR/AcrR family transcriptional regulator n=1 Tax=Sporofaciens sp. SGI.106 TaxID=3420568 RepID=UPI003D0043AD
MPPKPKFTRDEIVAAALDMVSERGMEALTARDLGQRLGSSARPIFTVFENMEEVQKEVRKAAMQRYNDYTNKGVHYTPAFKQFGMQMILFAKEEPKLFQMLFMTENEKAKSFEDIFEELGDMSKLCIEVIMRDYQLPEQDALQLFKHVWIHTFGIGALCAAKVCDFDEKEVSEMLTESFIGMMMVVKSGAKERYNIKPVKKDECDEKESDL